jgi:hypothetical protein
MSENKVPRTRAGRLAPILGLGFLLVLNACGLDDVEIPELDGPSELALSVTLTATPDIVAADGFSTSLVQATVRNENGQPVAGRQIFMAITDSEGRTLDLGQLRSTGTGGVGTGVVLTTGSNGIAQAAYEAPPRTDFTAHSSVLITARPVGTDFNGQVYRTVRIELRSAEPRLFPQVPPDDGIRCDFRVEPGAGPYRVNQVISFQSVSSSANGPIVRYEWFFGDGTSNNHPQEAKVYRFPGTYIVQHVVTDSLGFAQRCLTTPGITVIP